MFNINPLIPVGTPCRLCLEVRFTCEEGHGGLYAEKALIWPGVPQIGHTFAQTSVHLIPDGYKIHDIAFDEHDDTGAPPHLHLWLEECDLSLHRTKRNEVDAAKDTSKLIPLTEQLFLRCVSEYAADDWGFVGNPWWVRADGAQFNVLVDIDLDAYIDDGSDDDDDFDDEEEEQD
jgi:hypothetical protein